MFAAIPFPNIDPAVFTIPGFELFGLALGPFPLRWYALAYIAGLVIGWRYMVSLVKNDALWQPKQKRLSAIECDDFLFWATLGVILGGRLGYVLFYQILGSDKSRAALFDNPLSTFAIWEGGMSFHGGLIGVLIAVVYFARKTGIPLLTLGDIVATVTPIGLFFGRVANFINGELWGRTTDAPWGMVFCSNSIRNVHAGLCPAGDLPRHPSQLYEAALEGIVLLAALWFATYRSHTLKKPGLNAGIFLLGYGLIRASLENVRQPDAHMPDFPLGLTMGMMLSTPMILIGAWLIWRAMQSATPAPKKA